MTERLSQIIYSQSVVNKMKEGEVEKLIEKFKKENGVTFSPQVVDGRLVLTEQKNGK